MTDKLFAYGFFYKFFNLISLDVWFCILTGSLTAFFIILLIFSIIKPTFRQSDKGYFLMAGILTIILEGVIGLISKDAPLLSRVFYLLLSLFLSVLYYLVLRLLGRIKDGKNIEKANEFLDVLERQMKQEKEAEKGDVTLLKSEVKREEPLRIVAEDKDDFPIIEMKEQDKEYQTDKNTEDVSLSHAKVILERMNCFPLSIPDKRKLDELNYLIAQAEIDGIDGFNKERINDSLAGLIKIMSKYCV